jgi:DNA invertase Pin-like site-specific DNA recombinase
LSLATIFVRSKTSGSTRIIRERVNAGLARAKAKGVKLGRGNRKDLREIIKKLRRKLN